MDVYPTRNGTPVADLEKDDFEILKGKPQPVDQFRRIQIPRGAAGYAHQAEHRRGIAVDARKPRGASSCCSSTCPTSTSPPHRIRQPLIDALDRVIGQDDLVGVMTPEMSPNDMAFARKTTTIEGILTRYWHWGERDRMIPPDPEDEQYGFCYPNKSAPVGGEPDCRDQNGIAAEMIDRRHEKRTIDALQDLVRFLRGVREERKAILAITNGWLLFKPNYAMMKPLNCHPLPTGPQIQVDPRNGRPTPDSQQHGTVGLCDIDGRTGANRRRPGVPHSRKPTPTSFYPTPRPCVVRHADHAHRRARAPPPYAPSIDRAMLSGRLTSLRTLAENTDGLAIVDSNDLAGAFAAWWTT